jgi:zona occludens toxin
MAIKIHHGPPGSYKTAGAVNDDLIPAIMAGRPIVTNVRGISLETIEAALPDAPVGEIELIHIDTTTRDGREKFLTWFHWIPLGAFIFIDEAQAIFPKRWREADLKSADMDYELAKSEGRPQNWWDAWDMHRHYNWDIVLTTPEIDKIRDDIRGASELAYKHKNLGLYGFLFKGSYNEGIHSKDNGGTATSHFQAVRGKRIGKNSPVWKLYQSTATGDISETSAGFNIFSNPRLLIGVGILAYCGFSFATSSHDILGDANLAKSVNAPAEVVSAPRPPSPVPVADSGSIGQQLDSLPVAVTPSHPLSGAFITYNGFMKIGDSYQYFFAVNQNGRSYSYDNFQLESIGYDLEEVSYCSFVLHYGADHINAICRYS